MFETYTYHSYSFLCSEAFDILVSFLYLVQALPCILGKGVSFRVKEEYEAMQEQKCKIEGSLMFRFQNSSKHFSIAGK